MRFPFYKQLDQMDCGPTCLKMVAKYYGRSFPIEYLREKSHINRQGVSLLGIAQAAEAIGLRTLNVLINFETLADKVSLPCIVNWQQRHFLVVYKITAKWVYCADPAFGLIKYSKNNFIEGWLYNKNPASENIVLLLEPIPGFDSQNIPADNGNNSWFLLVNYLKTHTAAITQLLYGLIATTIIQLLFPFTTQAIVDYGINNRDIDFIYLILAGQLVLFLSQTMVGIIRSWILLHIGARINIAIVSDFLAKLMKLPLAFFDTKTTGDLLQRIEDNKRVESFLSSNTLNAMFSGISLVVFGGVLIFYNLKIFLLYFIFSAAYLVWVLLFAKRRAELDYKRYNAATENRSSILQLISGIAEIKLNNSERRRRWEWEGIQIKLYKFSVKSLSVLQLQVTGANFINELKNILILVIAAKAVVGGTITLGVMLSIQYILGQLNAPIQDIILFIQFAQDAKLSLQRLSEIHHLPNEEDPIPQSATVASGQSIFIKNVSLQYGGPLSKKVLDNISLTIPYGKVTAVVGASGSGKTSLLKLLLKFYTPSQGAITLGETALQDISAGAWRQMCGVVMQDGFIFADTIARNITESSLDDAIDKIKLKNAVEIANLTGLIEDLPLGYNTNLSWGGINLSGGENQRVLIARAVYKDPSYLFFDEATSSLDAGNEKAIMEKLSAFYKHKTVVVVAHRLSTVKQADQIIVLDKGAIVEIGNHNQLVSKEGYYYTLVKDQLELGK